jgi:hypothetical protein
MPRKGSKQPYKPRKEYRYSINDIANLAGITRNALNVAKAHGKIDPGDFASVVSFLTRRIIDNRLSGDLFASAGQSTKRPKGGKRRPKSLRKKP